MGGADSVNSLLSVLIFSLVIVMLYSLLWWIYSRRQNHVVSRELTEAALQLRVVHPGDDETRGLPPSVIASLPKFVYRETATSTATTAAGDDGRGTKECAVCLGCFKEEEIGLLLPNCKHMFHAQCIILWLGLHSTCPICRCEVEPHDALSRRIISFRV
ncbi:RING-H2 finger protein ATL39-like [Macadamia integrifolia]|uniref:RING-H2 finger protein ATL39-like n=1 Tax=Macadamia integrifolia TaxID=60698 RepID=UPI001C4EDC62|nr:RING-H2 finger protein ATL39-like [Macadamia integrifolia]